MLGLLGLIVTFAVTAMGYVQSRLFVRRRLAYVDMVQRARTPLLAGGAAALVALPVVGFLPLVGVGTAVSFGLGVGAGVAAGVRDIRRRLPAGH